MIAFVGAMDLEIDAILALMSPPIEGKVVSGVEFYEGTLGSKRCVVMKSGVGKVAAAITTTILFENFDIDGVVNIGTAGGLMEYEEVLDVIISDKIAHHDVDVPGWEKGFNQDRTCYTSDPHYLEVLKQIMEEENDRVFVGPIVTGDCFVYRDDQVETIKKYYPEAMCGEMEGAAIAQTCRHYNKPFIVVRSLSDIAIKEGNEMSFEEYATKAATRSAKWCEKFIQRV